MDETAAAWRAALVETMEPCRKLPLILSGGVDSGTLLAGLLDMGEKPHCYTFALAEEVNPDTKRARMMCKDYDLRLTEVRIPRTRSQLVGDVQHVIEMTRQSRKTVIQCAQPMLHVARAVARDGYYGCIIGTGAVVLDDRTVMVKFAEDPESAQEYRREKLGDRHDLSCGTGWMHEVCKIEGVPAEEPFSDDPLKTVALSLSIPELARGPKGNNIQKGIAWRAFPTFWQREGYWRRNQSFQVSTGIREWHDEVLLQDPELNPNGRHQKVVAIYNRMLEEVQSGAQSLF